MKSNLLVISPPPAPSQRGKGEEHRYTEMVLALLYKKGPQALLHSFTLPNKQLKHVLQISNVSKIPPKNAFEASFLLEIALNAIACVEQVITNRDPKLGYHDSPEVFLAERAPLPLRCVGLKIAQSYTENRNQNPATFSALTRTHTSAPVGTETTEKPKGAVDPDPTKSGKTGKGP